MRQKRREDHSQEADHAFYERLGRAIKVLRATRGIERKELAELSGVSYPYLSEIENGKKRPSSRALVAIAEALRVRPHELLRSADALPTGAAGRNHRADRPPEAASRRPALAAGAALAPPRSSWFHAPDADEEGALLESPSLPAISRFAAYPDDEADAEHAVHASRASMLEELAGLASRMPGEDVERLLDLARRLARSG